jgi:hypothetical protein
MALCETSSAGLKSKPPLFNLDDIPAPTTRRTAVYRCAGCGSEVAFDSLAAMCRCSEECYADDWSAPTDAPA